MAETTPVTIGVNTSVMLQETTVYDYYEYGHDLYNYTYDYNAAMDYLPLGEFIPTLLLYVVVGMVGLLGNLLVIVAIVNFSGMRSVTNMFLLSLATADLLLVLVCVPVKAAKSFSYTWRLGGFMCYLVPYIQNVSMICSVMTLTVMSIERFMAILMPLKARYICTMRHAKIVILCVWMQSFVMAVPVVFGQDYIKVGLSRPAYWCRLSFSTETLHKVYEMYMLIVIFVIPFGVMSLTYTWICIEVWVLVSKRAGMRSGSDCRYNVTSSLSSKMSNNVRRMPHNAYRTPSSTTMSSSNSTKRRESRDDARTSKQVIVMLIVIVVLFAVCWLPILINNVLAAFKIIDEFHFFFLKPMRLAFSLMSYANSCVNPIVYGFMSKHFRDTFKKAFMTCFRRKPKARLSISEHTRVSTMKTSEDKDSAYLSSTPEPRSQRHPNGHGDIYIEMRQTK